MHGTEEGRNRPHWKLIAVCACCGEGNEVALDCSQTGIQAMKEQIEKEVAEFELREDIQKLYKSLEVTNGVDFFKKATDILKIDSENDIMLGLQQAGLDYILQLLFDIAPKYWGMSLQIIEPETNPSLN